VINAMNEPTPDRLEEQPERVVPESEPALTAEEAAAAERRNLEYAIDPLFARGRRGANWFFWIAGLSLVNSAIIHFGGQTFFAIGLGTTLVVDGFATGVANQVPDAATIAKAVAVTIDVCVALLVAGFGLLARNRYTVVFAIGMALYLLDGLIFVLVVDLMGIAVHVVGLICMWQGFQAFRELNALQTSLAALSGPSPTEEYPAADEF
jgi:hypothetical protein